MNFSELFKLLCEFIDELMGIEKEEESEEV